MESVIKFNTSNEQLTDEEYSQFILNTLKSKGRKLFCDALAKEYKDRPYELDELTTITNKIIKARPPRTKPEFQSKSPKSNNLNDFPAEVLAECGSYLKTNEYINFGNCNRTLYKSLHSSSSQIQQLSHQQLNRYPEHLSMLKFKNITSLSFFLTDLHKLSSASDRDNIWNHSNNISTLRIHDNRGGGLQVDPLFNQFINDESVNLSNIKSLELNACTFSSFDSFVQFVSNFPSLESLTLIDIERDDYAESTTLTDELRKMLPNLKHFEFYSCAMADKIAISLSHQLQHISVPGGIDSNHPLFDAADALFVNLTELELHDTDDVRWMNAGFRNTTNLKVVHLSFKVEDKTHIEAINMMQTCFEQIITTQLSLERLIVMIRDRGEYDLVMTHLERALRSNRTTKRETDRLCIEFRIKAERDWTETVVANSTMVLNCEKLMHFVDGMFESIKIQFVIAECPSDDETLNGTISELAKLGSNYVVDHRYNGEGSTLNFSICNKECVDLV